MATQLQSAPVADCDTLLRRARELLDKGELASASAAGRDAAVRAMADYAGPGADFVAAAQRLVKDYRGHTDAAEWIVSAMALSDNAGYDWLDADGIARRLDDVQRLAILVKDIAEPPQSAEDVLRRAWECMDNGALPVASEKGWEAALWATKTYADAVGRHYKGEAYFDDVTRMLAKDEEQRRAVSEWTSGALNLREIRSYCIVYPYWLRTESVAEDIDSVAELAALIHRLVAV